jgi:hypothetical protein
VVAAAAPTRPSWYAPSLYYLNKSRDFATTGVVPSVRSCPPDFSLGSCLNADSLLLFSLPPFCLAEQLNKPAELRRNLVGTVDFTVPVSG